MKDKVFGAIGLVALIIGVLAATLPDPYTSYNDNLVVRTNATVRNALKFGASTNQWSSVSGTNLTLDGVIYPSRSLITNQLGIFTGATGSYVGGDAALHTVQSAQTNETFGSITGKVGVTTTGLAVMQNASGLVGSGAVMLETGANITVKSASGGLSGSDIVFAPTDTVDIGAGVKEGPVNYLQLTLVSTQRCRVFFTTQAYTSSVTNAATVTGASLNIGTNIVQLPVDTSLLGLRCSILLGRSEVGPNLISSTNFAVYAPYNGQDWNVQASWVISGGNMTHTAGNGNTAYIYPPVHAGSFRATYTVVTNNAGSVQWRAGGVNSAARSATGTYMDTNTVTTITTYTAGFLPSSDFDGYVTQTHFQELSSGDTVLIVNGVGGMSVTDRKKALANLSIAAVGDSITGYGLWQPSVSNILGPTFFDNYGYSGYAIAASSAVATNNIAYQSASMTNTDVVLVFGGTGDFANSLPMGTLGDTSITNFYGALSTVTTQVYSRSRDVKLVFITTLWRNSGGFGPTTTNSAGNTLQDYVNAIKTFGNSLSIPVVDMRANSGLNATTEAAYTINADALHPNLYGGRAIGSTIAKQVGALFESY